jgi:hypothetical protein
MAKVLDGGVVVSGRGLSAPVVGFSATAVEVTVQVDCDAHPEYWLMARFTKGQLIAMLAEIESEAEAERLFGGPVSEKEMSAERERQAGLTDEEREAEEAGGRLFAQKPVSA